MATLVLVRFLQVWGYILFMNTNKKKKAPRNPVAVAMNARYGQITTTMRDRRKRRAKDARRSWKNEDHG